MQLTLRYAVQSFVGRRSNNEDAAYAGPHLLAVADGMGGHAAGEIAAALAIEEVVELDRRSDPDPGRAIRAAFERANAAIAQRSDADPATRGMGTTLTALLFDGSRLTLGHVGDSRAYALTADGLRQITRDDSLVQDLIDEGRLTAEEAWEHPQRPVVTKVLTGHPVEPYVDTFDASAAERYLVCSDGVSDYVRADEIERVLAIADPQRVPQELIRTAIARGSQDNITCVVADVVEGASGYNIAMMAGAAGDVSSVVA